MLAVEFEICVCHYSASSAWHILKYGSEVQDEKRKHAFSDLLVTAEFLLWCRGPIQIEWPCSGGHDVSTPTKRMNIGNHENLGHIVHQFNKSITQKYSKVKTISCITIWYNNIIAFSKKKWLEGYIHQGANCNYIFVIRYKIVDIFVLLFSPWNILWIKFV